MIRVLCLAAALFAIAIPCVATDGVLVEERVVNLPQDQNKWYVSVVGQGDARQAEITGWFETNDNLNRLKGQVKFCPITSGTAIYQERYASNVTALPTVRVQKADGTVVYESSGNSIPMTADALYAAIANTSMSAQGIRPILPWRRQMENRCGPNGCPQPTPEPLPLPNEDPAPDPLDDGAAPDVAVPEERSPAALIGLLILSLLGGVTAGVVVVWKQTYGEK